MSEVEYTELYIGTFLIQEPITAITDILTAGVCIISFSLLHSMPVRDKAFNLMKFYLFFMGLGTLCAAFFSHAIVYITGHNFRVIGWTLSALGIYCIENGALIYFEREFKSKSLIKGLRIVFKLQLLFFLILLLFPIMRTFRIVQLNAVLGIFLISIPIFAYLHFNIGRLGYTKVLIALLLSILPGLVFSFEFTLHKYFNYHDLSHVLMAIVSLLLFYGIKQLGNETQESIVKY